MRSDLQLEPYLELLASFLTGSVDIPAFEGRYLDLFKRDEVIRPDEVFEVLDALFSDVDAYSPEPVDDEIGEERLRQSASQAYDRLRGFAQAGPSVG